MQPERILPIAFLDFNAGITQPFQLIPFQNVAIYGRINNGDTMPERVHGMQVLLDVFRKTVATTHGMTQLARHCGLGFLSKFTPSSCKASDFPPEGRSEYWHWYNHVATGINYCGI